VSSTGEEVFFKIKRSTKLSKLQGAYANKVGKDVSNIRCGAFLFLDNVSLGSTDVSDPMRMTWLCRFLYDGDRIGDDDTPGTLGMARRAFLSCSLLTYRHVLHLPGGKRCYRCHGGTSWGTLAFSMTRPHAPRSFACIPIVIAVAMYIFPLVHNFAACKIRLDYLCVILACSSDP